MKPCPKCGNQNEDRARFCNICGSSFVPIRRSGFSNSWILIGFITALGIVIICILTATLLGIGGFIYTTRNAKDKSAVIDQQMIIQNKTLTPSPTVALLSTDAAQPPILPEKETEIPDITPLPGKKPLAENRIVKQEWFSSGESYCKNVDALNQTEKGQVYGEVLGTQVKWEGVIKEITPPDIRVYPCNNPCFTAQLKNVPADQSSKLKKGQTILFDGLITNAGKDVACDYIEINVKSVQLK
jgi:hypothetical protein